MAIGNRIITRGMGPTRGTPGVPGRASMITMGYGGFFREVARQAVRLIRAGQSGTKRALRELQEVVVWAKLIRINDEKPKYPIQGSIKVRVSSASQIAVKIVERASVRVRAAWEDIKITVKRIK